MFLTLWSQKKCCCSGKHVLAAPWLLKSKASLQTGCVRAHCSARFIFPDVQLVFFSFSAAKTGTYSESTQWAPLSLQQARYVITGRSSRFSLKARVNMLTAPSIYPRAPIIHDSVLPAEQSGYTARGWGSTETFLLLIYSICFRCVSCSLRKVCFFQEQVQANVSSQEASYSSIPLEHMLVLKRSGYLPKDIDCILQTTLYIKISQYKWLCIRRGKEKTLEVSSKEKQFGN